MTDNSGDQYDGYFQMGASEQLNCELCGARVQKADRTLELHRQWHRDLPRQISERIAWER